MRSFHVTLGVVLMLGLCLCACGGGAQVPDTGGEAAQTTAPEAEQAKSSPEPTQVPPTEEAAGTRDNPVPIGVAVEVGDWEVAVKEVDPDAADVVAAENEFNDKPSAGESFVMIGLSATYRGEESGSFWVDMGYKLVGSGGNTFSDSCGVIPESLTDAGETFAGATVDGNLCFKVESAQVEGATLSLEPSFSFDSDSRRFFALR